MQITKQQLRKLKAISDGFSRIVERAQVAVPADELDAPKPSARRRRGKELVAFRKLLVDERRSGASVVAIAKKHGVTPAYIYQQPLDETKPTTNTKKRR